MLASAKKILVTGSTSFVGCRIINRFLADQKFEKIRCLVHSPENVDWLPEHDSLELFFGDLRKPDEVRDAFEGINLVLNVAPIFVAPQVVSLCIKLDIPHVLFFSSARKYSRLYESQAREIARCEKTIQDSELDYIILRPTMIYGDPRERTILPLSRYIRRYRIIPLPNRGDAMIRPVLVDDIVDLIYYLLELDSFGRRNYDIAGPRALTTRDLFSILAEKTDTSFYPILLPYWLSSVLTTVLKRFPFHQRHILQFLSFTEARTVDITPANRDLDFSPTDFTAGLEKYLTVKDSKET